MLKLLLLEDTNEDSVAIERALLGLPEKFEVVRVASVERGLLALEDQSYDGVLADFYLEDGDIHTFLDQLRSKPSTRFLPVIVISGVLDHESACALLEYGVSDFISKDSLSGSILWFSIQNAIHRAKHDRVANAEIDTRERMLGRVFESINDAFMMADANRRITRVNEVCEKLLGYKEEELLGKPTAVIYADVSDFTEQGKLRFNANSTSQVHSYKTVQYKKKNGEVFPAHTIGGALRDEGGELIGFMGIIRDVSDEIRQHQLRESHTRRLKLSNTLLEEFGHATSHSLRTPVQGMCRLATWIEEELEDPPERIVEYLKMMQERGELLDNMLRDLRTFVRAGEVETEVTQLSITGLLDELREKIGAQHTLHYDGPESFSAPRTAFEVVCDALVMNAAQHHDREGGNIWLRCEQGDAGVTLTCEDDGPGIKERHKERIFRLYQTLESAPGRIGVGLAVVQRVLTVVGGEIDVMSPVANQRGARFTVKF